jgi:hypothetical protein
VRMWTGLKLFGIGSKDRFLSTWWKTFALHKGQCISCGAASEDECDSMKIDKGLNLGLRLHFKTTTEGWLSSVMKLNNFNVPLLYHMNYSAVYLCT